MKRTNAEDFRTQLKTWMEEASKNPVRITRKSGQAFVLLEAQSFEDMQKELISLRGQYRGLLDAFKSRGVKSNKENLDDLFEEAPVGRAKSKTKKAVG